MPLHLPKFNPLSIYLSIQIFIYKLMSNKNNALTVKYESGLRTILTYANVSNHP